MGLDLVFNKADAVAAGLVTKICPRGSASEIAEAIEEGDLQYIEYLKREITLIQVPLVFDGWWLDGGSDPNQIVVRANKWGQSYGPLTEWLKSKNIVWSEF